jgi:hypothetical protein
MIAILATNKSSLKKHGHEKGGLESLISWVRGEICACFGTY